MITCRELAEFLFDLVSGQLPAERQELVERHLLSCSSCAAYADSYRLTMTLARELRSQPLPPDLAQQLRLLLEAAGSAYETESGGDAQQLQQGT